MAKYLIKASYSAEGTKGLLKDGGSNRKEAAGKLIEDMGGTLESFYFAFGDHDAYVIADIPNEVSAAAIGLKINASGLVGVSTTALLTPEQVDAACDKGATLAYRAPGT
jgi:uncharacterized protein with GYD domain